MDHHQRAELLGLLPERRKGRIGQFLAGDIGEDFDALELELLHAALELLRRLVAVGQRHAAERAQPVGVLADIFGDAVVERLRGLDRDLERDRVVELRRPGRDELHVDAHVVHHAKPRVGVADALADVGGLLGHDRLGLGVEKWSSGTLDGSRWGPAISPARGIATWACMSTVMLFGRDCLPGRAALARRGRFVLVPDVGHVPRCCPLSLQFRTRRDAAKRRRRQA